MFTPSQVYVDSREVAEMVDKRHADLVRSIDGYFTILSQNAKLRSDDFFKESKKDIEFKKDLGVVMSSRVVAEKLGRNHKYVLEALERLFFGDNSESQNIGSLVIPSTYKVEGQKREYKEYLLTKDGFTLYMFNIQS